METLGDTGCTKSCMSEAFLRKHPKLYKRYFRPLLSSARSIDGSKVVTVGIINIKFRLGKLYRRINCRVVRNLIHDFVLGWDFFSRYDAQMNAKEGYVSVRGEKIDLICNTSALSRAHYACMEATVVPPMSKVQFMASLLVSPDDLKSATNVVCLEPTHEFDADVRTARSISNVVNGGKVMVEAINPFSHPLTIPEGKVLGFADFVSSEEIDGECELSGMEMEYVSEDSAYESMEEASALSEDDEDLDERLERLRHVSDPEDDHLSLVDTEPESEAEDDSVFASQSESSSQTNPERDKPDPWKVDLSKVAPEAKDHLDKLKELFEVKHESVFAKHDRDYGRTTLTQHHARLIDKTPVHSPPYRAAPGQQKIIDEMVDGMLADGLLSPSTSAYSAPIMLVPKKAAGQYRLVTDFRKVNAVTQKVVYPLPRIDDALHRLQNPKFFTSLDLVKGFWQVPVAEEDRHIYAFSTGTQHVQYNVMPMGAKNSTPTLQALMGLLMKGLPVEHVICFLDDILVASETMEDHIKHLDQVLTALGRANLKVHPGKCAVARSSAVCLGHLLDKDGIRPDPHNLKKVRNWPVPKVVKDVRGFLGLTGYYRTFVQDYSKVAEPLTNLTAKGKKWEWGEKEKIAFKTLRDALTSSPIVAYPDFTKPFWVKTDASGGSVGFVLTQFHDERERVISYGSKKLDGTQRRWATYDREFFGLLTGIRGNSHFLRVKPFIAVTDHRPLLAWRKTDTKKDVTGRRMRWINELESYEFDLIYRQGRKHNDADALSRRGDQDEDYASDDEKLEGLEVESDFSAEKLTLLGMEDQDVETAVKYTCMSSYLKKLKAEQDADPIISNVKAYIKARRQPPKKLGNWYRRSFKALMLRNGVLFMRRFEPLTDLITIRAVIPPSLVAEILNDAHGSMLAGHPGKDRLKAKLERSVVWERMDKDIANHVEKCKQCDLTRKQNPAVKAPLEPIVAKRVNDHIIIDLLNLPTAPGGYNYVLVCMDVF